ncbi:hypothetical protein LCGC14_0948550 [marine sediment metagenome]|uniref:Uncharacterized protein n=1 Tax=marine sediment metagenome TaxID=412755 RepID=A0A0F9NMR0_9ZZZZ
MFGILRQFEENVRLTRLKEELRPASLTGENKCIRCGFCCNMRTCIPTPDELKEIAKFLKLTPKELINKYYAIDKTSSGDYYYIKPTGVNTRDLAGKFIPDDRTFNEGKCIFLEGKDCKIYSVRPNHAKTMECWKGGNMVEYNVHKFWKNNELKKEFGIEVKE